VKRTSIATAVSLALHVIVLLWLLRPAPSAPRTRPSVVAFAIAEPSRTPYGSAIASEGGSPSPHRRVLQATRRRLHARRVGGPASTTKLDERDARVTDDGASGADESDAGDPATGNGPRGGGGAAGTAYGAELVAPPKPRGDTRPPGLDSGSCVENVAYPWRAAAFNKEGVVRLRVSLGADGAVRDATIVQGAGWGFDETAVRAVKEHCRFTPAYGADDRPVPYIIDDYHFYFRLEDFATDANRSSRLRR
jgi:TonB family protein